MTFILSSLGSAVMLTIFLAMQARLNFLGLIAVEGVMSVVGCVYCAAAMVGNTHIFARLSGMSADEADAVMVRPFCQEEAILYMHCFVTAFILTLPIRWLQTCVLDIFMAMISAAYLGVSSAHPDDFAPSWILLLLVAIAVSMGKRSMEMSQRVSFVLVARERTLRAQAEHKLYNNQVAVEHAQEIETTSAFSMGTGKMFDLMSGDAIEAKLDEVSKLGLQEHWLVKPESLHVFPHQILGSGGFGVVMLASYHGAKVALKLCRSARTVRELDSVMSELRIYRCLRLPNIVTFYGSCIDPTRMDIALVLEYVEGGVPLRVAIPTAPNLG